MLLNIIFSAFDMRVLNVDLLSPVTSTVSPALQPSVLLLYDVVSQTPMMFFVLM